jgi:hypothetical protein
MRALIVNRTDRVMLAVTAISGVMFLACLGLMASNYRPLLGEDALAKDVNQQVYTELKASVSAVKAQMVQLPDLLGESFSTLAPSPTLESSLNLSAPLQGLINVSRSLMGAER